MTYTFGGREEWEPPHGSLDVAIPRNPPRILLQTILTSSFAICAYVYLNQLSPRTRRKSWTQLAIQTLFFLNLPEFLPLQIVSAVVGLIIEQSALSRDSSLRRFADIVSLSRFKNRSHVQVAASSPMYKAGYVAPVIQVCLLGLDAYISRFKISYHVATDVGNLGFDHRNGWLSAGGLLAGVLAISYRLTVWFKRRRLQHEEVEVALANLQSNEHASEENDKANSGQSGNSLRLQIGLETRIILVEGFFASAIHQFPLAATHRKTQLFNITGLFSLIAIILIMVSMKQSRLNIAVKAQFLLSVIAFVFSCLTIIESLLIDLDELYAANAGKVLPYNYRWKVTDRIDRILRSVV